MDLESFNYSLPEDLIAQYPCERRDMSKLLIYRRDDGSMEHKRFFNIVDYMKKGDMLILNNTKVMPARVMGRKESGGRIEALLLFKHKAENGKLAWRTLVRPSKGVKTGSIIYFDSGLAAEVTGGGENGFRDIMVLPSHDADALLKTGVTPLPPYIRRKEVPVDKKRYQTVFALKEGAVAAPTAGLHFTWELLNRLKKEGILLRFITLHTGAGTFLPIRQRDIEAHNMMREYYEIEKSVMDDIKRVKDEGGRVVAVGSTTTRALEASVAHGWDNLSLKGYADLFIYPGYVFKVIDALVTNFHLPCSTLLLLVSALLSREITLRLYGEAIRRNYRFYSYGDAMMIL